MELLLNRHDYGTGCFFTCACLVDSKVQSKDTSSIGCWESWSYYSPVWFFDNPSTSCATTCFVRGVR